MKISDKEKILLKLTLMLSSSGELPLLVYLACSSLKIKGGLRVSFSVTHHIYDKNGFCPFRFHSQAFVCSCPMSCVGSSAFLGQLDMGWMTSKVCMLEAPGWFPCCHVAALVACSPALPWFVYLGSLCNHSFYGVSLRTANLCPNLASLERR